MEIEDTEIDEALVSKATLARYRAKSKAKFREKGGISAALDKHDDEAHWNKMAALRKKGPEAVQAWRKSQGLNKEEVELDELSKEKLGQYAKAATGSIKQKSNALGQTRGRELAKFGATGGSKNQRDQNKINKREKYVGKAVDRITKEDDEMNLVDMVMTQEEPDASPYISEIEARCNAIVGETKALMQKSLFNFNVDEARKPKPGSPGGSTVDRAVADRFKKQGKEKKQFAGAKREIDRLKKKGK